MNILFLSSDRSLLDSRTDIKNYALERFKEYKKHCETITVFVHAEKKLCLTERHIGNLSIFPTNGKGKIDSVLRMAQMAEKRIKLHQPKINLIVSQDPFIFGLIGNYLSKKYHIPHQTNYLSLNIDNSWWLVEKKINHGLNILGKEILKSADSVRTECATQREQLIKLGVKPEKITIAPVILNETAFDKAKPFMKTKNIVLWVGRNSPEKNVEMFYNCAETTYKRNKATKFYVIGNGHTPPKVPYIKNLGVLCNRDVIRWIKTSDIVIITSKHEGIPLIALESYFCGKPVVSTDLPCLQEIIFNDKTGYLISPGHYIAMSEKIIHLLKNPEIARRMGEKGKMNVKRIYNKKRNLEKLVNSWKKLVRK